MICKTLFAFCVFTAGVRVQSLPSSTPLPASLPAKITSPTAIWTSSPQNTTAATTSATSGTHSSSLLPVTSSASAQTSPLPKDKSTEPREERTTQQASYWEGTSTDPSSPGVLTTNLGAHSTPTPTEPSSSPSAASVSSAGSPSPAESTTLVSPEAPASSPSSLSTLSPEGPSPSVTTDHGLAVTSTKPPGPLTSTVPSTVEQTSGGTPTSHATTELVTKKTTPQATVATTVNCELIDRETTTASPGVIMEQVEHALSSGSIAAITVTVIAVVLLVFGVAAYLKIRHSSYGRLLDDHDYGSWGNYNNPLYDDS
ncbi:prostate androgen-regulated mucin-like protein 1 [Tenrec ecaudatus]|uniref:prostate androgen-regulated mucin-like protein 1 n=1 Tax=Tenrec ecaudatus TaxID=94439 RepID=UPI003F5AC3AA